MTKEKMPFMQICINGRGDLAYNAILNMSGNGYALRISYV